MSGIKLASIKSDISKEQDGDWIAVPDLPGVEFKVRSIRYYPYIVARSLVARRLQKRFRDEIVPDPEISRAYGPVIAEHILLDWRGFDAPYSTEAARELLCDPAWYKLLNHVTWAATRVGDNQIEFDEDAEKN